MPIEFRCAECGRLLRTPDDAAGRQAQCPQCGALTTVPSPSPGGTAPSAGGPAAGPPAPAAGTGSPFAEPTMPPFAPPGQSPFAASNTANPYQSPLAWDGSEPVTGPSAADAAHRVLGPAIALIVTGTLGVLFWLGYGAVFVMAFFVEPGPRPAEPGVMVGVAIGAGAVLLVLITIYALVIYGAIKMKNLERYGMAMTASILAMLPCSYCCLIGLPFGIWALVVLNDVSVRAAFRN